MTNGQPFYALIIPQPAPGGPPTQPPVVNWPTFPSNPIARPPWGWGAQPPGIWGPIGNYPDAGFPGPQPGGPIGIWGGPYYPPVVSGGPIDPYPDIGFPGPQPPYPPRPTHPIYYPPTGIWGGPYFPPGYLGPSHPIVIPPEELPPQPVPPDKMVIAVFVPGYGYKVVVIPKPPGYNPPTGPSTEIPTPQQTKK